MSITLKDNPDIHSRKQFAVFEGRFVRSIQNLRTKLVFKIGDANWIDTLPEIRTKDNNTAHSTIKLTPVNSFLQKAQERSS